MIVLPYNNWEVALAAAAAVAVLAVVVWLIRRKRPTADEIERQRRQVLARTGRVVDGMLLDMYEMTDESGTTRTMLVYRYRIGGVDYECSQDVTTLPDQLKDGMVNAGFPCSVRYRQGSPQNSIVLAEEWSGLRTRSGKLRVPGNVPRR
jgi:hypothetical protein